jgi:hypothetical protein
MSYDVIAIACEKLSYRDKLRLAQLLIQMARKEEENANPQTRMESKPIAKKAKPQEVQQPTKVTDTVKHVIERLPKAKPKKKSSLINSIKAMFQFQGGISDSDVNKIISELQKRKYLKIEQNNVSYPQK